MFNVFKRYVKEKRAKVQTAVKKTKLFELLYRNDILYSKIDNIRILYGITAVEKEDLELKIDVLAMELKERKYEELFTDLQLSTLMIEGYLTNVRFLESELIDMLGYPEDNLISKIGCNYGEIFPPGALVPLEPNPIFKPAVLTEDSQQRIMYLSNVRGKDTVVYDEQSKSFRGKKKKNYKNKKNRKPQGSGAYMNSQITIEIYEPLMKKLYKIKLYRNGVISIPGGKFSSMVDVIRPLRVLCRYLQREFNMPVRCQILKSVMRNFTAKLLNDNFRINIREFEKVLTKEKDIDARRDPDDPDKIGLIYVSYNTDRFSGLMLKFARPDLLKNNKKSTIKVLASNKINIDGANSDLDAMYLFMILKKFVFKYRDQVVYDIQNDKIDVNQIYENVGIDDLSDASIYD
jgi:hypothetical protein